MANYGDQFMECPSCGDKAESEAVDVGVGLCIKGDYACRCGWEIFSESDFGFVKMMDREFCPEPLN